MRVAFVVQRYGVEVTGGAERLCRDVAERMARHWDVEVVTTRAVDYMTWKDEYPPGEQRVNGILVQRFSVDEPRDVERFTRISARVLGPAHDPEREEAWMRAQGPYSSGLLEFLRERSREYDWFIYFTYLYATTYYGLPLTAGRSLLVPTAHDEPPIYLDLFRPMFRLPRALIFSTPEEQAFVNERFGTAGVPQAVVGVGIEERASGDAGRFRRGAGAALQGSPFILYVGRVDPSKGCDDLFEHFTRFRTEQPRRPLKLALVGSAVMDVPASPDVVHLGFLSEEDKLDAMAAAEVIVLPSPYESLSIVALEAWHLGRPVLANGRCEVLRAQCLRANGGLWYESYEEFREALLLLLDERGLAAALGRSGRRFVDREYRWPVIEGKYLDLVSRLGRS